MPLRNNLQGLILGKQGSGKSLMARLLLATHAVDENRDYYISVSTKVDHIEPPITEDGKPSYELWLIRLGFEPLAVANDVIEGGFDLHDVLDEYPRVLITLKGTSPENTDAFMNRLGEVVLERGHSVLLVDEAEKFLPSRRRRPEGLLDLVRRGRYRGVDFILVSHTDTALHWEVFENTNFLIAFGIKSPTRIARLKHWLDDPNILADLKPFEYILVDEVGHKRVRRFSSKDFQEFQRSNPEVFKPVPHEDVVRMCKNLYS